MEIRDNHLYREAGFDGFVEYLQSKPWGIGQAEAYRRIKAGKVVAALDLPNPVNVAQAEALAPLLGKATPKVMQQVYEEVVEETDGKPTAAEIREKVRGVLSGTPAPTKIIKKPINAGEAVLKFGRRTDSLLDNDWHSEAAEILLSEDLDDDDIDYAASALEALSERAATLAAQFERKRPAV